ncbi:hypothetical protein [Aquiflexum gelatinilyticum]|uniref:hypothetical protein n=1 Tax=Aquiflexum gelatinilyticum TaxID=2961943 RepID=UPI0021676167|nr:hypothetical protein [Aquiflexum gelatinilyticum]MCS4436916.1 hypothetical protein [Aquiflexum gelatinilyticum]
MIGLFLKNWKFLLDILIVLAIVVGLFIWNPFGIFEGGLKLNETTNMVTEVRQIGQLVTAEYYGEVISSIDEARLNLIEDENIQTRGEILYQDIRSALKNLKNFQGLSKDERDEEYKKMTPVNNWRRIIRHEVDSRNIMDKLNFHGYLDDVALDPLYEDMLEYLYRIKTKKKKDEKWNPSTRNKEEALFLMYQEVPPPNDSLPSVDFMDFYYENKLADFSRKETRKKLAMVGRGWVKAGFDFTDLDPSAIVIYDDLAEVHIFGLAPSILDADINPWFIPEKGIPGFEILDYNGKVDFKDAKKVKEYCIEKLMAFAHRAEILKNAEIQGAETLKNLFSLITGKDVKKVVFHHDKISQMVAQIESDEAVSGFELSLIDSLLKMEFAVLDSLELAMKQDSKLIRTVEQKKKNIAFSVSRLQRLPMLGTSTNYGYFSKDILQITADGVLDESEMALLATLRLDWPFEGSIHYFSKSVPSPIYFWYNDPSEYMNAFNLSLQSLLRDNLVVGEIDTVSMQVAEVDSTFMHEHKVLNYNKINDREVILTLVKNPIDANPELTFKLYPITYNHLLIDDFIESTEIIDFANPKARNLALKDSLTYWDLYLDESLNLVFPDKYLDLLIPKAKESLLSKGYLKVGANYSILKKDRGFDNTLIKKDSLFSEIQSKELDMFIKLLLRERSEYQNKGALEKANRWVKAKLKERRATPTWLTSLRESVGRP